MTRRRWGLGLLVAVMSLLPVVSRGASDVSIPANRLIQLLNQTITLDRQTTLQAQIATEPEEQMLLYDNRRIADQILRFAFEFARAQADAMAAEPAPTPAADAGLPQYRALRQMLANLDKVFQQTSVEAETDRQQLTRATGARRAHLQSEISELQGEIALAQARRDAVRNMLDFMSGSAASSLGAGGLKAQIDALAASVPAASASAPSPGQARGAASAAPNPAAGSAAPSGIWGLTADLFSLSSEDRTVDLMVDETQALLRTAAELRAPLIARLRALSSTGDQLAAQADTAHRAQLALEKQQLDALAAQFRQISAAVIPLGKQGILLAQYRKNLVSWRDDIAARSGADLRSLGVHLGLLALVLSMLIGLSELWRRAVYRYVHDTRRRHQFLLLRRLAVWFVIAILIAIMLAGQFSSFVTFAGLFTAGMAIALQGVILSVVGYFFLIGKFGIRVGDRIEVNGITGEVIDIGLVRFHVTELGSGGMPTGRVVAFSNSVVFQPIGGLFKQISGAGFTWHQVTLTVPRDVDVASIKDNLLGAVERVLQDYRDEIERLYGEMEKRGILFSDRGLRPRLEIHLTPGGVDATIRYPVDLPHAADIDARVSREILAALKRDATLQTTEGRTIRLSPDVPA
ncbi:MAG TPA: mechanosensitive ion channel domain-containing protein [Vicinamibacterales bacterium]|nr:mechanosensitive ion channel domain-containing protein [Vicinamibacterales bacterium]